MFRTTTSTQHGQSARIVTRTEPANSLPLEHDGVLRAQNHNIYNCSAVGNVVSCYLTHRCAQVVTNLTDWLCGAEVDVRHIYFHAI